MMTHPVSIRSRYKERLPETELASSVHVQPFLVQPLNKPGTGCALPQKKSAPKGRMGSKEPPYMPVFIFVSFCLTESSWRILPGLSSLGENLLCDLFLYSIIKQAFVCAVMQMVWREKFHIILSINNKIKNRYEKSRYFEWKSEKEFQYSHVIEGSPKRCRVGWSGGRVFQSV